MFSYSEYKRWSQPSPEMKNHEYFMRAQEKKY